MRLSILIFLFVVGLIQHVLTQEYEPVIAEQNTVVDTFHQEYMVEDPYRWLENVDSNEVKSWIERENHLSKKYLRKVRNKSHSQILIDKYAYVRYQSPNKEGDYYFKYAYYNNSGVPALFYKRKLLDYDEILVDPNYISKKDRIELKGYSVSKDSKLLAYQFSRNGSDWAEIKVINLKTATHRSDHLKNVKFSGIKWLGNGFFYSTFKRRGKFDLAGPERVYYHHIGNDQQNDSLIFKRDNGRSEFFYTVTSNERFFVLKEKDEKRGRIHFFYVDYHSDNPRLMPLAVNVKQNSHIIDSYDGQLIAITYQEHGNGSIVAIDPSNPYQWKSIVPEYAEAYLENVIPFVDRMVAVYRVKQHPLIIIFDYQGQVLKSVEMPPATSVGGFSGNPDDDELLFHYSSYAIPRIVYKLNIKTFEMDLTGSTVVNFDFNDIETREIEYPARDSTMIPMVLVYKKGLELNGQNPVLLKTYGGFGITSSPSFNPGIVYFVQQGGVFAFANVRGGGRKGSSWANQGRGEHKQTCFNDFIDAAEFLIDQGYTSKKKVGIYGASHGGLVVAAAAIQRPDMFGAVVPYAGVMDMLRAEKFTVGQFHTDEFGTIQDSADFTRLYSYSPYHNIQEDIDYPPMLLIAGENDERVPPFHSYKFAAALQNREAQESPVILKVIEDAGHYGESSLWGNIEERADIFGFVMHELTKNHK